MTAKSTLIGRLFHDSKAIFEDQLEAIERSSRKRGDDNVNLALLTDGLRAEREQGITIDGPIVISRHHGASSSSQIHPGTSSTRETWLPVHRPPIWP